MENDEETLLAVNNVLRECGMKQMDRFIIRLVHSYTTLEVGNQIGKEVVDRLIVLEEEEIGEVMKNSTRKLSNTKGRV